MTTIQDEIKDKIKKTREGAAEGKSQQELEQDLGPGVEKIPQEPIKPDVVLERKDFFGVLDMKTMVDELAKLPDIENVQKDMEKYDAYEGQVRKLWIIKQSDSDNWKIRMRQIEKEDKDGRIAWKVSKGKYVTDDQTFYYNPITIHDKQHHDKLLNEREAARQDLLLETANLRSMAARLDLKEDELSDYRQRKPLMEKTAVFQASVQDYYIELFKSYFAATDDDVKRILFDDVMNYVDVALYKEQVKSPK